MRQNAIRLTAGVALVSVGLAVPTHTKIVRL